jgi:hypothetical protein
MRTILGVSLLLLLAGGASAADTDTAGNTIKAAIKTLGEMTTLLEGITDEKSADAAIPKLKKSSAKMREFGKQLKGYQLSADDQKKLRDKYQKDLRAAEKKMDTAAIGAATKVPTKEKAIAAALKGDS